jgi:hypothetical protein
MRVTEIERAQGNLFRWECNECTRKGRYVTTKQRAKSLGGKHRLDRHRRPARRLSSPPLEVLA